LVGFLIGRLLTGLTEATTVPAGVGDFAEMYVSTLLTQAGETTEEVLVPYLGYVPDLTGLEPGAWYVSHTAAWSIEKAGSDRWTVLVAADQLGVQEGGYVPVGTLFYEVHIEQTPIGLRATALPSPAATPSPPAHPSPEAVDTDGRLADAVAGFLTARFTGTDTTPFETVQVRTITTGNTDDDHLVVDVEFFGIDLAGRITPLSSRLEVSTIDSSIIESENINPESS
jgi:hypothetical protein